MPRSRRTTREAIKDLMDTLPKGVHLSAQELRDRVGEGGENVSLSTIYRALERLQENGDVRSILSARGQLWEPVGHDDEPHDHLICTSCGLTIEFSDALVSGFGKTVASRKGYVYHESRFDIFGLCSKCRGQRKAIQNDAIREILESATEALEESRRILDDCLADLEEGSTGQMKKNLKRLRLAACDLVEGVDEASDLLD